MWFVVCLLKRLIASSSVLFVNCAFLWPLPLLTFRLRKLVTFWYIYVYFVICALNFVAVRNYCIFIEKILVFRWHILGGMLNINHAFHCAAACEF